MKPIFIAASPNTEKDDVLLAFKTLFSPKNWYKESITKEFEQKITEYFGKEYKAKAFDSARSSLYLILKYYGIKEGDEVILPSFSCLVIANPVIWLGAKPVYADIDKKTLNIDLDDLKKKLNNKTKAILIQHTFGNPINVEEIRKIVGKNVIIIEDIAHALGGSYENKKIGSFGDAAILTFGIEKVISTVRGGMVLTKNTELDDYLKRQQSNLPSFSKKRILLSLINPIYWWIITPVYYWGIGKITIGRIFTFISHKLNLLGNMIEDCEYDTQKPSWLPARMPGALSSLGLLQITKLDRFNDHRIKISQIYNNYLGTPFEVLKNSKHIYLRYPAVVDNPKLIIHKAKAHGVVLGDWYKTILYAPKTSFQKLQYTQGDTKVAEEIAAKIINLPTGINVSEKDAEMIARLIC
jgi:perosamine synthetase